ncbi:hypothetical protein M1B72_16430 [Geomonas paludis]|uniref:TIGR04255 family protein n=1 Tax=Geomonas paludis TaxID=2740185 RepID=A0ABY4LB84_9BACT|nr:hypothetical protein [Geomonas paludis]UPU35024.1 hypothetical protein M1B72_16430 [Geomonas paludis]
MALPKPKRQDLSIIMVGDFNPKIFHPSWFASEGLIKESESEDAEIEIIRPEIAIFSLDWLKLSITRDRFAAETNKEPYFEVMRDLVVGSFRILSHTPIKMLGINLKKHYTLPEKSWHHFGNTLAPKDIWDGLLVKPGLETLTLRSERQDNYKGYVRVTAGPEDAEGQLYVNINDHFTVVEDPSDNVLGSTKIVDILESEWGTSMARSNTIIDHLMERAS